MNKEKLKNYNFLPLFTLCFCLGVCLVRLWRIPFIFLYIGCWVMVILAFAFLKKELSIWLLLISGISLGALFLKNFYILPSSHISKFAFYKSGPVLLKGTVDSPPQFNGRLSSFVLASEELTYKDKVYRLTGRVLVKVFRKENIVYGQRVLLEGRLRKPCGYSGNRLFRDYLRGQNIYSILTVGCNKPIKYLGFGKASLLKIFTNRIRERAHNIYFKYLPPAQAGIFSAILLGDRSQITPYFQRLFVQTGTAHILAISGLHIGIVVFILNLFLKALRIKRRLRYAIIIISLIFYCLLTGARPSVIRATIMAVVLLAGFFFKRQMPISYSLSLAALVILMANPQQLFNIGFQLSFGSVVAIVYLYPKIKQLLFSKDCSSKILKFIIDAFCVSLSAWLGLSVLITHYFKIISPVTVLANMVVIPYFSLVISTGIVLIFTGIFLPVIAPVFSAAANFTLVLLIYIIKFFNQLPFAYFYLP